MILERNNVATILFCLHKLGVPSGYASSHFAHASSHFSHFASHFSHFASHSSHFASHFRIKARLGPIEGTAKPFCYKDLLLQ